MPVTCWTSCPPPCCRLITWDATEEETGAAFVGLWDLWGRSADLLPRWNRVNLSFEQKVKDLDRSTECSSSSEQPWDIYASPCLPNTSEHSLWSLSTITDNLSAPFCTTDKTRSLFKHSIKLTALLCSGLTQTETNRKYNWRCHEQNRCCLIISWW